ncbi:MAG: NADPH:quinone oxidoreductase family protein [Sneathiellales bacterium]|nr:NADPH:quinone oxidoreductase family protein [Sneathiellales bacterium]
MAKAKAVQCKMLSGPDNLVLEESEISEPGKTEILIDIHAASLNFPDLLMTYGKYQFKPELPFTPGMEGAGVISAVGADVCQFTTGERVMFKGKTGACATKICVEEEHVSRLPANLSFEEGAAFAVTFQTAYVSLKRRGRLKAGETLLVLGAGGGVGQATVAVGKALGATVIAAASSAEKLEIARQSGADYLINYGEVDLVKTVLEITDGQGVSLLLDPVGGALMPQGIDTLGQGGRYLIVGFASGDFGKADLKKVRNREIDLIGVRAGEYGRRNPEAGASASQELVKLTEKEKLIPWIGRTWALEETINALKAMESREVLGKQVIKITGEV